MGEQHWRKGGQRQTQSRSDPTRQGAREEVSTHLAGLGINVAHVEESLNHSHVLFPPHRGECSQHEGCVASPILAVNLADPWESGGGQ